MGARLGKSTCFFLLLGCCIQPPLATAIEAESVQRWYGRGVHAYFRGDVQTAQDQLTKGIEAGTEDPRCYYFRALVFLRTGREELAKQDMERGARFEAHDTNGVYPVDQSLERIQGRTRLMLQQYRLQARTAVDEQMEQRRRDRYESMLATQASIVRQPIRVPLESLSDKSSKPSVEVVTSPPPPIEPDKATGPVGDPFADDEPAEPVNVANQVGAEPVVAKGEAAERPAPAGFGAAAPGGFGSGEFGSGAAPAPGKASGVQAKLGSAMDKASALFKGLQGMMSGAPGGGGPPQTPPAGGAFGADEAEGLEFGPPAKQAQAKAGEASDEGFGDFGTPVPAAGAAKKTPPVAGFADGPADAGDPFGSTAEPQRNASGRPSRTTRPSRRGNPPAGSEAPAGAITGSSQPAAEEAFPRAQMRAQPKSGANRAIGSSGFTSPKVVPPPRDAKQNEPQDGENQEAPDTEENKGADDKENKDSDGEESLFDE